MEEDDDDLYDPADSFPPQQEQSNYNQPTEQANGGDSYEFEEEEEDDDDFNIITEAPADAAPNLAHPRHATLINEAQRSASADIRPSSTTPSIPVKAESVTPAPVHGRPVATLKPGTAYPPVHVSTIDVNADPVHPTTGKPITETDLDTDFPTEEDKPWRLPGTDITDFFNYGFDEFSWASYCLKQQELRKDVTNQRKQLEEMQTFMSMGGMPGMPGAPTPTPAPPPPAPSAASAGGMPAMPGMPGMPDMSADMMQGMLANMMAQGLDPSAMDPMAFMQNVQAMMGGQPGGGQQNQGYPAQGNQQQMGGYGGYNQQGGGYGGGRGRGGGARRW